MHPSEGMTPTTLPRSASWSIARAAAAALLSEFGLVTGMARSNVGDHFVLSTDHFDIAIAGDVPEVAAVLPEPIRAIVLRVWTAKLAV